MLVCSHSHPPASSSVSTTLLFSIIVPTHARPAHLSRCLDALGAVDYPADKYELVIVDDAASRETESQVLAASRAVACAVRYVPHGPHHGPAKARNAGAAVAAGRYLAFTDDDCTPAPDWLNVFERALSGGERLVAGGTTINALPDMPCAVASQALVDYLYDYHRVGRTPRRFFTSNNFSVRAAVFREVGGFDQTFPLAAGEDREFCERWMAHGGELVHAEEAIVRHWHQLDLRRFLRQHFNYGRGAHFLQRSRATPEGHPGRSWPAREPLAFYARMLQYPFSQQRPRAAVVTSSLLAVSQAAYVAGYVYQRTR